MTLPITADNLADWFPAPHTENPFAGDPWWQMQGLGRLCAVQLWRLLPDGDIKQQALIELRRALDTGLLALPVPPDDVIKRRMAQTLAPWCPSPVEVIEAMLGLADLKPNETLLDLGSGDGRIVFEAAARGAFATGIDIDARFVAECEERKDGMVNGRHRTHFVQGDLMTAEWGDFDVVTCYLLSSSMEALIPRFKALKPGTRIVSHAFGMPDWPPTALVPVGQVPIFLWVV